MLHFRFPNFQRDGGTALHCKASHFKENRVVSITSCMIAYPRTRHQHHAHTEWALSRPSYHPPRLGELYWNCTRVPVTGRDGNMRHDTCFDIATTSHCGMLLVLWAEYRAPFYSELQGAHCSENGDFNSAQCSLCHSSQRHIDDNASIAWHCTSGAMHCQWDLDAYL